MGGLPKIEFKTYLPYPDDSIASKLYPYCTENRSEVEFFYFEREKNQFYELLKTLDKKGVIKQKGKLVTMMDVIEVTREHKVSFIEKPELNPDEQAEAVWRQDFIIRYSTEPAIFENYLTIIHSEKPPISGVLTGPKPHEFDHVGLDDLIEENNPIHINTPARRDRILERKLWLQVYAPVVYMSVRLDQKGRRNHIRTLNGGALDFESDAQKPDMLKKPEILRLAKLYNCPITRKNKMLQTQFANHKLSYQLQE